MKINLNKSKLLIISLTIIVTQYGCYNKKESSNINSEYEFDDINLSKYNPQGDLAWRLNSPQAKYDDIKKVIRSKSTSIKIYSNKKQEYIINADSLTSLDDTNLILLEGNVKLSKTNSKNLIIIGDSLIWDTINSKIKIHTNPKVYSDNYIVYPHNISFDTNSKILELQGKVQLIVKKTKFTISNKDNVIIDGKNIIWNLDSGKLESNEKVTAQGYNNAADNKYTFTSKSLKGNTQSNYLSLQDCIAHRKAISTTYANKCNLSFNLDKPDNTMHQKLFNITPIKINKSESRIEFVSNKNDVKTDFIINELERSFKLMD